MSIPFLSTIIAIFTGSSGELTLALNTAEAAAVNGLKFLDGLITVGASVEATVLDEVKVLETKLTPAVTAAKADVKGAVNAVKTILSEVETFIASRVVTTAQGAEDGEKMTAAMIHIA